MLEIISSEKDTEGLISLLAGNQLTGDTTLMPCTPLGIEMLLKAYDIPLERKK